MPVKYGKLREDVHSAFGETIDASQSGFSIYGQWSGPSIHRAQLCGHLEDGSVFKLEASPVNLDEFPPLQSVINKGLAHSLLRKTWRLIREKRFREVFIKAKTLIQRVPPKHHDFPLDVVRTECTKAQPGRTILVMDHELGGGANLYREKIVSEYLSAGDAVLLLSFNLLSLQYTLEIHTKGHKNRRIAAPNREIVTTLAQSGLIDEVFFNNSVSFPCPEEVPVMLATLAREYGLPVTVAIHDYFTICPSHFLLDHNGHYCDTPEPSVCETCLPKNTFGFCSLFTEGNILTWRERWGTCLSSVKNILCFSESSKRLLSRVYPSLPSNKVEVRPHTMEYFPSETLAIPHGEPLHIGVVGSIEFHKGSQILGLLAEEIVSQGLNIPITVFGTVETKCDPCVVSTTGPYLHSQLPDMIDCSQANLFFIPSIWPETFSYVTQELITMNVPIACFDWGAPSERIANYPLGRVIQYGDAGAILKQLIEFHTSITKLGLRELPRP